METETRPGIDSILFETSPREFHQFPTTYLHYFE